MENVDRKFMEMAVAQARKQLKKYRLDEDGDRPNPRVGCVVVTKAGKYRAGFRGELEPGEHAEFTVLEKKMPEDVLAGATVYTTLEPCTHRNPPKKSCADRLIERRVARVVIGYMDPDDRGRGYTKLSDANITVDLFPPDLVSEIQELNRRFIELRKKKEPNRTVDPLSPVEGYSDAVGAALHDRAVEKIKYADAQTLADLKRYGAIPLNCVDQAIEIYSDADLLSDDIVNVINDGSYNAEKYESENLTAQQLTDISGDWPSDISDYLKSRIGRVGSGKSQCKIGFSRLNVSDRGLGGGPKLAITPITYWTVRQFNKESALPKNPDVLELHHKYAELLFTSAEDFACECPSALYLEVALVTQDRLVPVIFKDARHSVMSVRAGGEVRTCGPEFGLVWATHVSEGEEGAHLNIAKALGDSLLDEFGIRLSEVEHWNIDTLAIQGITLNAALVGVVKLRISAAEFAERVNVSKYHSAIEGFLSEGQLLERVQADHSKGLWHPTGLLRLVKADRYLRSALS